jgi:ketosteroid isomerase-like protein
MWPSPLPHAPEADGGPAAKVTGFYEALEAGDSERAAGILGPDVALSEAPGRPYASADELRRGGDEAVRHILAPLGTGVTGLEIVTHELLAYGSTIIALGTYWSHVPGAGTGRKVPFAHVWVFEGTAVRELRQYAAWQRS